MADLQRARSAGAAKRRGDKGAVTTSSTRQLRCAVYTRKSSEEGLDQDFNSLQAQREACEAYIASQRHEGWRLVATAYDDGGYSGGSMERPGLVRLLADVQSRRIDVVVVYKVDRLTRALADFAKIVEIFDCVGVSFVSVTQSFNTTTSMGRLTLNVLLSFAQFEREVTAERIRDKIAASKRKGMWMGGPVPLGYRVENRKLIVDEHEAETVRMIFTLYLEMRSTIATARALKQRDVLTRKRIRADGTSIGGIPFTRGPLQALLRNRVYIGELIHKGQHHPGEHQPILLRETFEVVQQLLTEQCVARSAYRHRKAALLTGRIFDSNGNRMTPSHVSKHGVRYCYYVSRALLDGEKDRAGHPARIPAAEVENLVISALRAEAEKHHHPVPNSDMTLVEIMLASVQVHADYIILTLARAEDASDDLARSGNECATTITLPCVLGMRHAERRLVPTVQAADDDQRQRNGPQAGNRRRLLDAIYRARGWLDELQRGTVESTLAIAEREGRSDRNVRMFLNLAFLAPDLIEAVIDGAFPSSLSASQLAQALPLDWTEQRRMILSASAT